MNKILNWIVLSSENPEKVSMTVRGILLTWVAMALFVSQFLGLDFSEAKASYIVQDVTALVGAVMLAVGLVRKIVNQLKKPKVEKEEAGIEFG